MNTYDNDARRLNTGTFLGNLRAVLRRWLDRERELVSLRNAVGMMSEARRADAAEWHDMRDLNRELRADALRLRWLAEDHATPSGGQEAGPEEDRIEAAYWRFDARHKGYGQWKTAPMSERDAFKAEMRNALAAEKVRAEMRLVANGWRRPGA